MEVQKRVKREGRQWVQLWVAGCCGVMGRVGKMGRNGRVSCCWCMAVRAVLHGIVGRQAVGWLVHGFVDSFGVMQGGKGS